MGIFVYCYYIIYQAKLLKKYIVSMLISVVK